MKSLAVLIPLLQEIWSEVFTHNWCEQVAYMLANYQSQANIEDEMKKGAHYLLLVHDSNQWDIRPMKKMKKKSILANFISMLIRAEKVLCNI